MRMILNVALLFCAVSGCLMAELRISMADAMKAVTSKVQPQYSPIARQMKIAGHVELEATIGPDGTVVSAKALSGNPMLTQPAIAAVEKWIFTPFSNNGAPTKAVVKLGFDFRP